MKTALITGITGQDGSYLAELLLGEGYVVHGVIRRSSSFNTGRIDHIYQDRHEPDARLFLHYGDLSDGTALRRILQEARPDEMYNLGAQSHVRVSFDQPEYTTNIDALGYLRLLEAVRDYVGTSGQQVRVYQAGTSEMFGDAAPPQTEATPFRPRSPYAIAKVAAHHFGVNYREAYDLFVANGILFNHESARRGETFVTRKITRAAARIKLGIQDRLYLGNLDAKRDWGHAADYVRAMWLMLQHDEPGDYVIATGTSRTIREFAAAAFGRVDLDWEAHVQLDDRLLRPTEVDDLRGDASRARNDLGWEPRVSFEELVDEMIENDLALARKERILLDAQQLSDSKGSRRG